MSKAVLRTTLYNYSRLTLTMSLYIICETLSNVHLL